MFVLSERTKIVVEYGLVDFTSLSSYNLYHKFGVHKVCILTLGFTLPTKGVFSFSSHYSFPSALAPLR